MDEDEFIPTELPRFRFSIGHHVAQTMKLNKYRKFLSDGVELVRNRMIHMELLRVYGSTALDNRCVKDLLYKHGISLDGISNIDKDDFCNAILKILDDNKNFQGFSNLHVKELSNQLISVQIPSSIRYMVSPKSSAYSNVYVEDFMFSNPLIQHLKTKTLDSITCEIYDVFKNTKHVMRERYTYYNFDNDTIQPMYLELSNIVILLNKNLFILMLDGAMKDLSKSLNSKLEVLSMNNINISNGMLGRALCVLTKDDTKHIKETILTQPIITSSRRQPLENSIEELIRKDLEVLKAKLIKKHLKFQMDALVQQRSKSNPIDDYISGGGGASIIGSVGRF